MFATLQLSALNGHKPFRELYCTRPLEGITLLGRLVSRDKMDFIREHFCLGPREGQPSRDSDEYHPTQLIDHSTKVLTEVSRANWKLGEISCIDEVGCIDKSGRSELKIRNDHKPIPYRNEDIVHCDRGKYAIGYSLGQVTNCSQK